MAHLWGGGGGGRQEARTLLVLVNRAATEALCKSSKFILQLTNFYNYIVLDKILDTNLHNYKNDTVTM